MAPGRLHAIRAFLLVALGISAYLAFLSLTGNRAVGCGPDSGCEKVLTSRWAYWFGIPVSAFALAVDATFLVATFRLGGNAPAPAQRRAWTILIPCALTVAGAALWFITLQLAVVHSICAYCMAAHGAGLAAAVLTLRCTPPRSLPTKPWALDKTVFVNPVLFRKLAALAFLALAALVLGQVAHTPKTFVVQQIPAESPVTSLTPATPSAQATPAPSAPGPAPAPPVSSRASRMFPLYNGRHVVDVADVPTIGSPTNAQVMVALHDYTCSHCRLMHPILVEAQSLFSNQLVVVTLPMPFDPGCNPLIQRHNPKHTNACVYARLSLAVWRADRTKHHDYDAYLFATKEVPPVPAARATAEQLVGASALASALADPWVDQNVRLGIALYETAYRAGQGQMPQFMIGRNVAVGTLPMANLLELLANNLGLVTTASAATGTTTPGPPH